MLDGADLIATFGRRYIVRRETGEGRYVDGRWESSSRVREFPIIASVQPIDGRTLERLPEAQRTREARKLYTSEVLQNTVEELGRKADLINIDGERWEVATVELWGPMLDHSRCIIIKMNTDEGVTR